MEKYFVPAEIIVEILSRLPAESVLECRRVCKNWRGLTLHPSFARLHLLHRGGISAPKVDFISISLFDSENFCRLHYGEYDDEKHIDQQSYKKRINHPHFTEANALVGSCNGLICLAIYDEDGLKDAAYIYNPITRESINLPRFTETRFMCQFSRSVLGFGYHPKTNSYKVVKVYYYDHNRDSVGHVYIYTLGGGNGWKYKGETKYTLQCSFKLEWCPCRWSSLLAGLQESGCVL